MAAPAGEFQGSLEAGQSFAGGGNGYDAVSGSTMRGYLYWPQLDTRKEIDRYTHQEVMRRARALTENMGLAGHIIEGLADVLGYLTPLAATKDTKWNREANANFRATQENPNIFDASGKFGFSEAQGHLNQAAFRDGDLLPVKTKTGTGRAQLAMYEAHQIANPYGIDARADGWFLGVKVNRFGRHLEYSLTDPDERMKVTRLDANATLYYGHFKKHGHVRPLSILRHAINHLMDMAEIVRDVKYGIKVRNQIPLTLETDAAGGSFLGSASQAIAGTVRQKSVPALDGAGNATTQKINYEEIMQGGNIPQLKPGQSLKALIDAAPHPNQLALLDWMVRDIAWGAGLPPEILWDINSLRGANNRLLNSLLQRWVGARLLRLRTFVAEFWRYHCSCEMKAGRLRACGDPEWWKVVMLPQASLTADKGKEGKLNIELVANRMMTLQDWFALDGKFWLDELAQLAEEDGELRQLGLAVGDVARRKGQAEEARRDSGKKEDEEEPDEDEEDEKQRAA